MEKLEPLLQPVTPKADPCMILVGFGVPGAVPVDGLLPGCEASGDDDGDGDDDEDNDDVDDDDALCLVPTTAPTTTPTTMRANTTPPIIMRRLRRHHGLLVSCGAWYKAGGTLVNS